MPRRGRARRLRGRPSSRRRGAIRDREPLRRRAARTGPSRPRATEQAPTRAAPRPWQYADTVASYFPDAPFAILAPSGGDHSYYHDREDGAWGSYVLHAAIPEALRRTGATRVAIGGISMGGFGALDLARIAPRRFCAVGAHSPALWLSGGETPAGAFDDDADFERHDVLDHAAAEGRLGHGPVWLDMGEEDPFRAATVELGRRLGRHAELHVWPGGHDGDYWRAHGREYVRFYERACR